MQAISSQNVILADEIPRALAAGWRVECQTSTGMILKRSNQPRHIVHALMTLFTAGLWLPVWLISALFARDEHLSVTVDEIGQVVKTPLH